MSSPPHSPCICLGLKFVLNSLSVL
jgi:hypothetical protein